MRVEGWEERLDAAIDGRRTLRWKWGKHDCLMAACKLLDAMTEPEVRWIEQLAALGYPGQPRVVEYRSRDKAVALLNALGGYRVALESALTHILGDPYPTVRLARRGDVVMLDSQIEDFDLVALGIVDMHGTHAIVAALRGWGAVPVADALKAWHVPF